MLVEYWSNGYNIEINHLAYGKNIDQFNYQPTLDISGLHLQTTVDDLSSTGFFLNINSAHDTFNGNDYADVIRGGIGDDHIWGFGGNDTLYGEADSDVIYGGGGHDLIFGGTGTDFAAIGNNSYNYNYARNADGSVTVTDVSGGVFGSDKTLYDVEYLMFNNGTFAIGSLVPPPTPPVTPPAPPAPTAKNINGSSASETIYGDSLGDILRGNNGNDRLYGLDGDDKLYGGTGKDTLFGGAGKDTFVFNTKLNKTTNYDKVVDYNVTDDTIWLDNSVFKKLGKGSEFIPKKTSKSFFTIGDKAKDSNDYIIYNKDKGILYYDADGSGTGAAVQFAAINKKLKMTYNDFFVV